MANRAYFYRVVRTARTLNETPYSITTWTGTARIDVTVKGVVFRNVTLQDLNVVYIYW
jgi:hypothetical protein